MLKKRVIFTLLYDNGMFVLSRNFRLQKVGDFQWLKNNYNFSKIALSIDELIILDVSRNDKKEANFLKHIGLLTEECFIPISAGGGVKTLECARELLHSGADKIVVNTLIAESPNIVSEIIAEFGSQSVVASVDFKFESESESESDYSVWTNNGSVRQDKNLSEWLSYLDLLGVGEIYLNSIDRDGVGQGYQLNFGVNFFDKISVPIILAGGAGKSQHFEEGLALDHIDAVATANLFNFVGSGLELSRLSLIKKGFKLPTWNYSHFSSLKDTFNIL